MTGPDPRPLPPLDQQVRELARQPGRTWGVPDAVLGILAVPAALLLAVLVLSRAPALPDAVATAVASAVLAAVGAAAAWRAARQSGGFRRAFGLDFPGWRDLGRVVGWMLLLLVVQTLVLVVLTLAFPELRDAPVENIGFLRDEPVVAVLLVGVLAVVVAPVVEELLFRGLVLRGLMLGIGFWPAAVVSSAFFGLFHAQATGLRGLPIVAATGVFGLGLCVLVRRTGRLGPAIGVHALRNAIGIAAVLLS
jgi:membrane protease YdiL (CAAX protease family)